MFRAIVLSLCSLVVVACQQKKSTLEQALDLKCNSTQELERNQQTITNIQANYCTQVLSDLAPKAPEGIQPKWSRENPYPSLPDYFLYPDTNPMQINGKRLQSIATCIHKRCLALTQKPENYCGVPNCSDNPGAFIIDTFLSLARTCTAEPYTEQKIIQRVRSIYQEQTGSPIQWCSNLPQETTRDLRVAFGERVDACQPGAEQCAHDYRCVSEAVGFRCRPMKPIAAPEIPGIHFQPAVEPQPAGASCALSRDCQTGLICGRAPHTSGLCAKACETKSDCDDSYQCLQTSTPISFCTPSCTPGAQKIHDANENMISVCVKTKQGGRWVRVHKEQVHIIQNAKDSGVFPTSELLAHATCGNGIEEFGESCDRGAQNGEVQRGSWCTSNCQIAECGNGVLEAGEHCECSLRYHHAFSTSQELQKLYQLPTTCPGRHAISDGTEKALGFSCHSCGIIHARHMRDTRENSYFLPEFDPFNPPQKEQSP